jgi:hypothetical protein
MSEDWQFSEQGSYWFGGLLPAITQRAFKESSMLAGLSLDAVTNQIILCGPSNTTEDRNINDLFEFESLVSLTALVHERFHYVQDLFYGFGHLAYELQCLLYRDIQASVHKPILIAPSGQFFGVETHRWGRLVQIYRLLTERIGGHWIAESISKVSPSYDFALIGDSTCLELLETHAALLTYLDLSRRLSIASEVQDHLRTIHIDKMASRYKRLFDFFVQVVAGKELYDFIRLHDSSLSRIYEINLISLACIVLELSLHVPPVEIFYETWGDGSKFQSWLQFHPLYRFAASCGALDYLNEESKGQTVMAILEGRINAPKLVTDIENKYGWWIPYQEITKMWGDYYENLREKGVLEKLRERAVKLRQEDPVLISQIANPLSYFQTDTPLVVLANDDLFEFNASSLIGPIKEIHSENEALYKSLREHRMKLCLLKALLLT